MSWPYLSCCVHVFYTEHVQVFHLASKEEVAGQIAEIKKEVKRKTKKGVKNQKHMEKQKVKKHQLKKKVVRRQYLKKQQVKSKNIQKYKNEVQRQVRKQQAVKRKHQLHGADEEAQIGA